MKIKVLTIKDIIKYLAKMSIVFCVITIFAKFFYGKRNVNSYFEFNSVEFISTINKEIRLLKNDTNYNVENIKKNYIKNTINSEFSMFQTVAVTNINNLINSNEQETNKEILDNNTKENQVNNDENNVNEEIEDAKTGVNVEVLPSNIPDKSTYEIFGVKLRNESDYNLENEITDLNADFNKQDILIFHTHTCESYTPTEQYTYESTGNYRTTDLNYTVAKVGDELEKYLSNYGFTVVHDKSYHDYPSYNGSYNRSLVTVQNLLESHTNTDVVIDLHRDAIGDNTYAPTVKIGEDYCARVMLVIGTDGGGLTHKNWRNNLKFAIKLAQKGNELYPGFFKPIIVRNSRYNHHVSNAACIIEVGATGNTLEQCLNSMKYLAKVYNEM
ncbi:MAG: stage II sporulation protein P [Clostridia bacterium]|nr:stage II sporulation protein P [Clostridia bacterium]